jgi:hypothetical protein
MPRSGASPRRRRSSSSPSRARARAIRWSVHSRADACPPSIRPTATPSIFRATGSSSPPCGRRGCITKARISTTYERFETVRLASDAALLKRFVFLLGAERRGPEQGESHLERCLLKESESAGRELTNKFYQLYADIRQQVFGHSGSPMPEHRVAPRNPALHPEAARPRPVLRLLRRSRPAPAEHRPLRLRAQRSLQSQAHLGKLPRSVPLGRCRQCRAEDPRLQRRPLCASRPGLDTLAVPDEVMRPVP